MAAAGPCPLQSSVVDLHAGECPGEAVLLPGHRVPVGHADLQQCAAGEHGPPDGAHSEVLLLGGESKGKERHYTKGIG